MEELAPLALLMTLALLVLMVALVLLAPLKALVLTLPLAGMLLVVPLEGVHPAGTVGDVIRPAGAHRRWRRRCGAHSDGATGSARSAGTP